MKLKSTMLFLFIAVHLFGQSQDSTSVLLPPENKAEEVTKKWPVPKKALLFSIIPGGGQLYNKKWWKVPLVYGAIGAGGYWVYQNQKAYRFYRDLLLQEISEPGSTNSTPTTIRNTRDKFDKSTQQAYVYLGLIYILQATEAFVDAHLAHFDVSDDLSWHIKPSTQMITTSLTPSVGVSLIIPLAKTRKNKPTGNLFTK